MKKKPRHNNSSLSNQEAGQDYQDAYDTTAVAGADTAAVQFGHNTAIPGGDTTGVAGGHNTGVSGGHNTAVAGGHNTGVSGGHNTDVAGGHNTGVSGGHNTGVAIGHNTGVTGGATTDVAGEDNTAVVQPTKLKMLDTTGVSSGDTTDVADGETTALAVNTGVAQSTKLKMLDSLLKETAVPDEDKTAVPGIHDNVAAATGEDTNSAAGADTNRAADGDTSASAGIDTTADTVGEDGTEGAEEDTTAAIAEDTTAATGKDTTSGQYGCKKCEVGPETHLYICKKCKKPAVKDPYHCNSCDIGAVVGTYSCRKCKTDFKQMCSEGWVDARDENLGCLLFENSTLEHSVAEQYCKDRSAHLVEVLDTVQQEFIEKKLTDVYMTTAHKNWWGGATPGAAEETWKWPVSGEAVQDFVWAEGLKPGLATTKDASSNEEAGQDYQNYGTPMDHTAAPVDPIVTPLGPTAAAVGPTAAPVDPENRKPVPASTNAGNWVGLVFSSDYHFKARPVQDEKPPYAFPLICQKEERGSKDGATKGRATTEVGSIMKEETIELT